MRALYLLLGKYRSRGRSCLRIKSSLLTAWIFFFWLFWRIVWLCYLFLKYGYRNSDMSSPKCFDRVTFCAWATIANRSSSDNWALGLLKTVFQLWRSVVSITYSVGEGWEEGKGGTGKVGRFGYLWAGPFKWIERLWECCGWQISFSK